MRLLDKNFKTQWKRYLFQVLLAAVLVSLLQLIAHILASTTVLASIGASIFIATTVPHANSARPRYMIGGYVCGTLAGFLGQLLIFCFPFFHIAGIAGFVVGLAMLLMVVFNFEHPPAAALALGIATLENPLLPALISLACICIIALFKTLLKRWLINLI